MIIIIDAYNILKYVYHDEYITEKQRAQFVQQLVRYGKKKGHELIVVFDGGPHGMPDRRVTKPVTVIYTGAQERADDFIIRSMKQYKTYDVLIVSTDREITNRAEKYDIPYIDSNLFYRFVRAAVGKPEEKKLPVTEAQRLHDEVLPTLDALMESVEVPQYLAQDEEGVETYVSQEKRLSKNDRRLMNIVDKL